MYFSGESFKPQSQILRLHMKNYLKVITLYTVIITFLIGWWGLAFRRPSSNRELHVASHKSSFSNDFYGNLDVTLLAIDRRLLKNALAGDFNQMSLFISDWDIDAQLLQAQGINGIKRLSPQDLLQSKILIRQINNPSEKSHDSPEAFVIDGAKRSIPLKKSYKRFLPQTFAAASFLLAIVPTDHIVALPRHLREHTELYSKEITSTIPLDIDRYNGEKLFQKKPDIAFIAHYSHPATVQALQNQGITLYTTRDLTSVKAIGEELINIGTIVQRKNEAKLMKIFIDAALLALDNKQQYLIEKHQKTQTPLPTVLVLNYHQKFSIASNETLNGQIISRLDKFMLSLEKIGEVASGNSWGIPIDKERLTYLNPDCLIVITDTKAPIEQVFYNDQALRSLKAQKNHHIFFVDEGIHHSPTQYIILAYYDLIEILGSLP